MCNLADAIEEKGIEKGSHQTALAYAKKMFVNNDSYEKVRDFISELTDDELKAIYKEVTGKEIE